MNDTEKRVVDVSAIRLMLKEEIQNLRDDETNPAHLNALTNATGKILSSIKIEMEYAKLIGQTQKLNIVY